MRTNQKVKSSKKSVSSVFKFISSLWIAIVLAGCQSTALQEDNSVLRDTSHRTFQSSAFQIKVSVLPEWHVVGDEVVDELSKVGKKVFAGENKMLEAAIEQSSSRTENIFVITRYEVGAPVMFNPNLTSVSEDVSIAPGLKSGKDYLYHARKLMEASTIPYVFSENVTTHTISGKLFHRLSMAADLGGIELNQNIYAALFGRKIVAFIISYSVEKEKILLEEMLKSSVIKTK